MQMSYFSGIHMRIVFLVVFFLSEVFLFVFKMMFFTVLVAYSAFVLTSIHTDYYKQGVGKIFEYYVYIWAFGDFVEEAISCFVSINVSIII